MAVAHLDLTHDGQARAGKVFSRPSAALYVMWAAFWLLMIVIGLQDYYRSHGTRWWEPVLWEGSSAVFATCWLVLQRRVDRDYAVHLDQPLRWIGQHIKWLPLMMVTFIVAVFSIRHGVYALLGATYHHESWLYVFVYESIKLVLFFSLWLGLIFGLDTFEQSQEQRQHLLTLQKSLAEAQLAHLKAQLRPHFFFNVLNTISALMQIDVARADRLLARLADLLRATLHWGEQEITSVREEVRILELYAQIMQERFADRVTLAWRIADATLAGAIPALLLQPLLENAFKHGVERSRDPVRIEIESRRVEDRLVITVRNSGPPLAPSHHEGVGLRNVRERLLVLYADAASLQLTQDGDAVEARIRLPWRVAASSGASGDDRA